MEDKTKDQKDQDKLEDQAKPEPEVEDEFNSLAKESFDSSESSNTESSSYPQGLDEPPVEKSNKRLFVIGVIILILVILATSAAFFIWFKSFSKEDVEIVTPKEIEVKTATDEAELSSSKSLNRSEWGMEVLNGSGVTGAAKKAAQKLTDLGYQVVKTGNAENQNYPKTELYISKEKLDEKDLLLEDLNSEFKIASLSGQLEDSTPSARLILGKE